MVFHVSCCGQGEVGTILERKKETIGPILKKEIQRSEKIVSTNTSLIWSPRAFELDQWVTSIRLIDVAFITS